jgi:hypothetical protein
VHQGFFPTLGLGSSDICWDYFTIFGGGTIAPRVLGMIIGILNNISFFVVKASSNAIGFRNIVVKQRFIFLSTFFISYINAGLFATESPAEMQYLSIQWFETFAPMIITSLIITNLLPYLGVVIDLMVNKCCKKAKRSSLEAKRIENRIYN